LQVAQRALAPGSNLAATRWVAERVAIADCPGFSDDSAYAAMDFLLGALGEIRRRSSTRFAHLLNLDVDIVFVDTTSTYWEVDSADELADLQPDPEADDGVGKAVEGAQRRFGKSKGHRDNLPQVVIAMAVTRDGIPVRCPAWSPAISAVPLLEAVMPCRSSATTKAAPISLSAWANPGADEIECRRRASQWSSLLAPKHTIAVYVNDLRGYSMFRAVVRDSLPTRLNHVVINDAETPGGQSRVERVERLYRGFVEVAVKPQHSDAINRGIGQRVFEPARKKADLVIEQPVALEIRPDLRFRHRQYGRKEVQPHPFICFVICGVRAWHARERIG
jgi:hypothetical protein